MKLDLSKKSFGFQLIFWMSLGPFFLVAILSALMLQFAQGQLALSVVSMSGLFLCWIYQIRGFVLSLAFLSLVFVIQPPDHLWGSLCCLIPILSALFLTALCMQEVREAIAKKESQLSALQSTCSKLEKNQRDEASVTTRLVDENQMLKMQLEENRQWIDRLKRLMNVSQKESMRAREMVVDFQQKLRLAHEKIASLQTRPALPPTAAIAAFVPNDQLIKELNDLRVRHYQLELIASQYQKQLKAMRAKVSGLAKLKSRSDVLERQLKQAQAQPIQTPDQRQLKEQFEQKDAQLHTARRERASLEMQLEIQKRKTEDALYQIDEEVQILCAALKALS